MPKVTRLLGALAACLAGHVAMAQAAKPNILVIFGDDVGYWNVSAYNAGMMGYQTPNIDRIANEGAIFTDAYAQQSCTAGRAAFITGQSPIRTGLTKVGLPGAPEGLSAKDPTIANLLKGQGYATGQFGKNHLGDRNEFIPTVHGFDEFFGNFYHLNAEEEPENVDYPKDPAFKEKFGPRGVFRCVATATVTPGGDPRFGPWGKQKCEDTGPLTKKRMETIDYEVADAAQDFIKRQNAAKQALVRLVQHEPHARLDAPAPRGQGQDRARRLRRRHDGARRSRRPDAEVAGRTRRREGHDRHLELGQRRRGDELAGRRHDAFPRREEHQLGRRLPRSAGRALARRDQTGHRGERRHLARGSGCRR